MLQALGAIVFIFYFTPMQGLLFKEELKLVIYSMYGVEFSHSYQPLNSTMYMP